MFREESVKRLAEIRRLIRRVVDARFPPARSLRDDQRLEKKREHAAARAEREVLNAIIHRIIAATPTIAKTDALFDSMVEEFPLSRNMSWGYVNFETGLADWRALEAHFSHLRRRRHIEPPANSTRHRGMYETPEYAVLGFAIYRLSDPEILALVSDGCSNVSGLKEAARCLAPASS